MIREWWKNLRQVLVLWIYPELKQEAKELAGQFWKECGEFQQMSLGWAAEEIRRLDKNFHEELTRLQGEFDAALRELGDEGEEWKR
jgi:hypothetical protein